MVGRSDLHRTSNISEDCVLALRPTNQRIEQLCLLSSILDLCDGPKGPLGHVLTTDVGGHGQDLLPDLRREAQHAHDLGHPGAGDVRLFRLITATPFALPRTLTNALLNPIKGSAFGSLMSHFAGISRTLHPKNGGSSCRPGSISTPFTRTEGDRIVQEYVDITQQ